MDKYDIVVLAGQSNAEGNGLGAVRRPYREDPRVFALRDKNAGLIGFDDKGLLRVGGDFDPDITVAREKVTVKRLRISVYRLQGNTSQTDF